MNENDVRDSRGRGPQAAVADRRASEWLVLLESGEATPEDRARFEAWLAAEPGHREDYDALSETWERLTAMRRRLQASGDAATLDLPRRRSRSKPAVAWVAAAAALSAVALAIAVFLPGDSAIAYRTDVGERRTLSLDDGSTVELNTATELVVEYTGAHRRISMHRGEAFFDVARDADRPFTVAAGHGAIRAVGTGFAVRLKSPDHVSIMVTEGTVEVVQSTGREPGAAQTEQTAKPPLLQRGERAEYDRNATRIEQVTSAELERTQAWRRGLLVFENASLAEVVAEVNRYTTTQLILADPELAEVRLGGTFKAGRLEALLGVLESGFDIRIVRARPDTIELHAPQRESHAT